MSVQCHFLSTTLYKKKKKFFKLTLVPIATEMSLNIKRLQTLTASSVVDCTACLVHGRMGWGLCREGRGFTYTPLGAVQGFTDALQLVHQRLILLARKKIFVH